MGGVPSFNCTTQFGVTNKLAAGAITKDTEQHCLQYGPLRDTPYCWLPLGHWVIDHKSLDVVIQSISYPSTSLSIKPISINSNLQVMLYGTTTKDLEKSKMIIHQHSHCIARLVRLDLSLIKTWLLSNHLCLPSILKDLPVVVGPWSYQAQRWDCVAVFKALIFTLFKWM